jgi:hypothetical protein
VPVFLSPTHQNNHIEGAKKIQKDIKEQKCCVIYGCTLEFQEPLLARIFEKKSKAGRHVSQSDTQGNKKRRRRT